MVYKRFLPKRRTFRKEGYNYSGGGTYSITICTKNRECFFGNVIDGKMELNDVGKKIQELWMEIPNKFKDTKLDAFLVMPNHIHGIIIIGNYWGYARSTVRVSDAINRVPTMKNGHDGGITGKKNPMLSENALPKIIRWYKGRCSFEIRKMENVECFGWHPRYYDQIIKNRKELKKKREYIWDNPSKWVLDELNPRILL
jgi:hypothetical protein